MALKILFANYENANCYAFGAENLTQNISAPGMVKNGEAAFSVTAYLSNKVLCMYSYKKAAPFLKANLIEGYCA